MISGHQSGRQRKEQYVGKRRLNPFDIRASVRTKVGGSISCGDEVATALAGVDHEALFQFAATVGIDVAKYDHLNAGQKRMNVGNRLRNLVKKGGVEVAALAALPRVPEPVKAVKAAEETDEVAALT